MKIKIDISAEDLTDVKSHLTIIREQLINAIKHPDEDNMLTYTGIGSYHSITIENEKES